METALLDLQNNNATLTDDFRVIDKLSEILLSCEDSEDSMVMRHFGNELKHFGGRLNRKIENVITKLSEVKESVANDPSKCALVNNLIANLSTETQKNRETKTYRAEESLHLNELNESQFGFIPLSSKEMYSRIGIHGGSISPVIHLWESCLHNSNGKVQTALRNFINHIERNPGEFSSHVMSISSSVSDVQRSYDTLKRLGNWTDRLTEVNDDNLKASESAIALASYVLGDNNVYVSSDIVSKVQAKHIDYLKSIV